MRKMKVIFALLILVVVANAGSLKPLQNKMVSTLKNSQVRVQAPSTILSRNQLNLPRSSHLDTSLEDDEEQAELEAEEEEEKRQMEEGEEPSEDSDNRPEPSNKGSLPPVVDPPRPENYTSPATPAPQPELPQQTEYTHPKKGGKSNHKKPDHHKPTGPHHDPRSQPPQPFPKPEPQPEVYIPLPPSTGDTGTITDEDEDEENQPVSLNGNN